MNNGCDYDSPCSVCSCRRNCHVQCEMTDEELEDEEAAYEYAQDRRDEEKTYENLERTY